MKPIRNLLCLVLLCPACLDNNRLSSIVIDELDYRKECFDLGGAEFHIGESGGNFHKVCVFKRKVNETNQ